MFNYDNSIDSTYGNTKILGTYIGNTIKGIEKFEKNTLNPYGYTYLTGTISGIVRLGLAIFELLLSLLTLLAAPFILIINKKAAKHLFTTSGMLILFSLANLIRALIEIIPGGGKLIEYSDYDKKLAFNFDYLA